MKDVGNFEAQTPNRCSEKKSAIFFRTFTGTSVFCNVYLFLTFKFLPE